MRIKSSDGKVNKVEFLIRIKRENVESWLQGIRHLNYFNDEGQKGDRE